MSRFAAPEGFSDQKLIWGHMETAADMAAGKSDYALANQLYAFCGKVKSCVLAPVPHRYIAGNDCSELHKDGKP